MSKYEMSPNTKKKALLLCDELRDCVDMNCYSVGRKHLINLVSMIDRHIKKEDKL